MNPAPRVIDAVHRMKGVFLEIPGTRLTLAQAARLSGLDSPLCKLALTALEHARFLKRGRDGLYTRLTIDSPHS